LAVVDGKQVFVPAERFTVLGDAVKIDSIAGFDAPLWREPPGPAEDAKALRQLPRCGDIWATTERAQSHARVDAIGPICRRVAPLRIEGCDAAAMTGPAGRRSTPADQTSSQINRE
jgi:hypothetical protein